MRRIRLLLAAWSFALPAGAADHHSHTVAQDPLTRQIHRKAIENGGGITSVVRLSDGRTLALKIVELDVQQVGGAGSKTVAFSAPGDALSGVAPAAGLLPKRGAAKRQKPPKQAVEQARTIKKDGWTGGRGHRNPL